MSAPFCVLYGIDAVNRRDLWKFIGRAVVVGAGFGGGCGSVYNGN